MQLREEIEERRKPRAVGELIKNANGTVGIANEYRTPMFKLELVG